MRNVLDSSSSKFLETDRGLQVSQVGAKAFEEGSSSSKFLETDRGSQVSQVAQVGATALVEGYAE